MANATLVVKLHDTYPPVEAVLESTIGGTMAPINLGPAEKVKFIMKPSGTGIPKGGYCTYPEPSSGNVIYKWQAGDTDTIGVYRVEWEIHWSGGLGIETVPNGGYDTIEIIEDLG